jgi:16S rRNA processing protein RimM
LPADDDRLVAVGRVGRPHGLAGAFVVDDASDAPERLAVGARLLADGAVVEVVESKRAGGRRVVRLDRDVPRGTLLQVRRGDLPGPGEDSYYVVDLVGAAVVEEGGRVLGRVAAVAPGVANDVLELDSGIHLPFAETCVREVDVAAGVVVVHHGFAEPG